MDPRMTIMPMYTESAMYIGSEADITEYYNFLVDISTQNNYQGVWIQQREISDTQHVIIVLVMQCDDESDTLFDVGDPEMTYGGSYRARLQRVVNQGYIQTGFED